MSYIDISEEEYRNFADYLITQYIALSRECLNVPVLINNIVTEFKILTGHINNDKISFLDTDHIISEIGTTNIWPIRIELSSFYRQRGLKLTNINDQQYYQIEYPCMAKKA